MGCGVHDFEALAAVLPYQEAVAGGPIGPPAVLGSRHVGGFKG